MHRAQAFAFMLTRKDSESAGLTMDVRDMQQNQIQKAGEKDQVFSELFRHTGVIVAVEPAVHCRGNDHTRIEESSVRAAFTAP